MGLCLAAMKIYDQQKVRTKTDFVYRFAKKILFVCDNRMTLL